MFVGSLRQAAFEYGLELTDLQIKQFDEYYKLLIEWNEKVNLTAIVDPREVAVKHMIDSLSCYSSEIFPEDGLVIDVGSGAGFPGVPLKIYRPDLQVTFLDSLNKRLVFLQHIGTTLSLSQFNLIHSRAEDAGNRADMRETYDIAVSRAVARLSVLCELCMPFVAKGGYFVALKGAQYAEELSEADNAIKLLGGTIESVRPIKLPGIDDKRAVIYIRKIAKTPRKYPRRPGIPEKMPL